MTVEPFHWKTPAEQREFVLEAAARTGKAAVVIEKDFWVCRMLEECFALPAIGEHLTFKGGTSLSKVYGAIERFSEDIDLAIHRSYLGFSGEHEPEEAPSRKKREQRVESLSAACVRTIRNRLYPALLERVAGYESIGPEALLIDEHDAQVLLFHYPRCLEEQSGYIRPFIRLEFGARSDNWPLETHEVVSYLEQEFGEHLQAGRIPVRVLAAERTFWEKATILHAEHHRPLEKDFPDRQSRHYYDLVCLARHPAGERALARTDLLARVAEHKSVYFRSGWARYDLAQPGRLRLVPRQERLPSLRRDYAAMGEMFFQTPPPFEELTQALSELESRINQGRVS